VIGLFVAVISYRRVEAGARLLAVMLLAEVGILIVLMAAILWQGVPEGYSFRSFDPGTWSLAAIGPLLVVTFVVFIGFEQTAVYSEEVKDPARTVPLATYTAVLLLAVIYTAFSWLILMAAGPSQIMEKQAADPQNLVFNINTAYLGTAMTDVMLVFIVTSFIAGVLALHNAASRYLYALGRSGVLPGRLATTNSTTGSPGFAVVTQAVIVLTAIAAFGVSKLDPYTQVVIWTNTPTLVGVLFLQLLTSIAVIRYFLGSPRGEGAWNRLITPAISVVLLAGVLVLVCTQLGMLTFLGPLGTFLINAPLIVAFILSYIRAPEGSPEVLLNDEM
jgi:amino acid transporter